MYLPAVYWQALVDGASTIHLYFLAWAACFLAIIFCFFASIIVVKKYYKNLGPLETISLGMSGSPLILAIFCFFFVYLGTVLFIIIFALIFTTVIRNTSTNHFHPSNSRTGRKSLEIRSLEKDAWIKLILFIALFVNLVLVKSGYIYGLEFPLNIDSVNHTFYIHQIISSKNLSGLSYYHYAFHYVIIAIHMVTKMDIPKIMLIFGQLLQIIAPMALFFPVSRATKNAYAGMLAVFVAGFGWNMPSQATSWGKYPVLMASTCVVFVLSISYTYLFQKNKYLSQLLFLLLALVTTIFIQSRMLILFLAGIVYFMLKQWMIRDKRFKIAISVLAGLCFLIILTFRIGQRGDFYSAFYPYTQTNLWPLMIALIPFSLAYFSDFTLNIFIFTLLAVILTTIPAPPILSIFGAETLLDRPFLSIFLFIPFSFIVGIEFAGLEKFIEAQLRGTLWIHTLMVLFIAFCIILPSKKVIQPQPDVAFVSQNDPLLYREIENGLPSDATILIPNDPPDYFRGLDGGAWIEFVTGRQVVRMQYDRNLSFSEAHEEICHLGARYIYVGSKPYSFSRDEIESRKDWYRLLINYPDVKLYKMRGCTSDSKIGLNP